MSDAAYIFIGVMLPILGWMAVILILYFTIEHKEKEPTHSSDTDNYELYKQFCDVDIILSRYENASILNINYFNYDLFEMEMRFVFDTPDEKEAFFEKYPSMKQRYQCLEYFLWRVSSHK